MDNHIDFSDFRQILQSLENSDIRIRVRTKGESWRGFSRLLLLSDSAMILQTKDDQVIVSLKNVAEFQLESTFSYLKGNTVYEVIYGA